MKRNTTFELLIDLHKRERDRAARIAAQARRDADAAGSTLQMLQGYRLDYDTKSPTRSVQPINTGKVKVHEKFTARLDTAIDEQDTISAQLADVSRTREQALSERQRRLKALETVAQRLEMAERLRQRRTEQKATDEFATQAFLRAKTRSRNT